MKVNERVVIPTDAVGLDEICGDIQTQLADNIVWLTHVFGKAQRLTKRQGGKIEKFPAIHYKGHDYVDMMPQESLGNFTFFDFEDPSNIAPYGMQSKKIEVKCAIIFWMDLEKVYDNPLLRQSERAKQEVIDFVNFNMRLKNGRFEVESIQEKIENIYKGYTVEEVKDKFLNQPFYGFRLNGKIKYTQKCI